MARGERTAPPKIDLDKQGKHIGGNRNFIAGRSILSHPDPQVLLDQWAGTGSPVNNVPVGQGGSKERVDFGEIIGEYVDPLTGKGVSTSKGIIVYDRRGNAHIIPARP
jgi:filamentous hemagglutinin